MQHARRSAATAPRSFTKPVDRSTAPRPGAGRSAAAQPTSPSGSERVPRSASHSEGTSIAWVAPGGAIKWQTAGRGARTVGNGSGPWVSDKDRKAGWGITFQSGDTVISRKITRKLKLATRARITGAVFGGSTVYVPNRGIINYAKGKSFYYFNANTGNSDDLAHANTPITEMGLGARGTTMVFAAEGGDADFVDTPLFQGPAVIDPNGPPTVAPAPVLPKPVRFQSIYVKVLPTVGCGSGC